MILERYVVGTPVRTTEKYNQENSNILAGQVGTIVQIESLDNDLKYQVKFNNPFLNLMLKMNLFWFDYKDLVAV